jgi:hypothetical protein
MDVVGGVHLIEGAEVKVITGIDRPGVGTHCSCSDSQCSSEPTASRSTDEVTSVISRLTASGSSAIGT